MLSIPAYIQASGTVKSQIEYQWKPYKGTELIEKFSQNLADAVSKTSLRANFSLAVGVAEWLVWRLDSRSEYPQLHHHHNPRHPTNVSDLTNDLFHEQRSCHPKLQC